VFTESLLNNERLFWLRYSGFRASCHNIFDRIDPDAEISESDLNDICSNSDDGEASSSVDVDDGGNNVGGG
jgi:hypothetical protein